MWIRVENSFYELEIQEMGQLIECFNRNALIKTKRQVGMQSTEKGLVFIELTNVHPIFKACGQEYLNPSNISGFGIIDENSEEWCKIKQIALGEPGIVKPDLKLVVDEV